MVRLWYRWLTHSWALRVAYALHFEQLKCSPLTTTWCWRKLLSLNLRTAWIWKHQNKYLGGCLIVCVFKKSKSVRFSHLEAVDSLVMGSGQGLKVPSMQSFMGSQLHIYSKHLIISTSIMPLFCHQSNFDRKSVSNSIKSSVVNAWDSLCWFPYIL